MRICSPTFGLSVSSADQPDAVAKTVDWLRDRVVIFGNNKPNAKEILEGVAAGLTKIRDGSPIDYLFKNNASAAAPADQINEIAGKYKIALLALAD